MCKTVRDILQIAGYDVAELEQLIANKTNGHTAEPPSGVAGYTGSNQQSKVATEPVNQSAQNKVK